jgi:cytochrome c oxidase subunit 4
VSSVKMNALILGALLFLTGLTYWTATLDLGFLDTPVALLIAFGKTSLVVLYFMHVRWSSSHTKLLAATGFVFLLFMFGFTFSDILTRTREYPWSEYTWPGAAHRTDIVGDVPEAPRAVEGVIPEIADEPAGHDNHGASTPH